MFLSSNEKGMDVPAEYEPFIQIKCGVCFHRFSCYFRAHSCFEISIRVLKRINKTSFCEYIVKVNVWIGACYYHLGAIESALDRYSETVLDELQTSQEVEKHSNSKLLFQLMTDCFRKMKYFAAAEACSEHPKTVFGIMRWRRWSLPVVYLHTIFTHNPTAFKLLQRTCHPSNVPSFSLQELPVILQLKESAKRLVDMQGMRDTSPPQNGTLQKLWIQYRWSQLNIGSSSARW